MADANMPSKELQREAWSFLLGASSSPERRLCVTSLVEAVSHFNAGLIGGRQSIGVSMTPDQAPQIKFDFADANFLRCAVSYQALQDEDSREARAVMAVLARTLEIRLMGWKPQVALKEDRTRQDSFKIEISARCPA